MNTRGFKVVAHVKYGATLLGRRLEVDAIVVHYHEDDDVAMVKQWVDGAVRCRFSVRVKDPKVFLTLAPFEGYASDDAPALYERPN